MVAILIIILFILISPILIFVIDKLVALVKRLIDNYIN